MNSSARVLGAAFLGLALTACATRQAVRVEAANTLANAPVLARTTNAPAVLGSDELYYGDRWAAANLFERAADADPTPANRFALAAVYERTGRTAEAAALYRPLLTDGKYVSMILAPPASDRRTPLQRVNIAEESARRLAALEPQARLANVDATSGPVSAAELGVPAAAVVGTPIGRISDADALARDASAEP